MECSIVTNEEANHTVVSTFVPGRGLLNATSGHPNFSAIKEMALAVLSGDSVDPNEFADLFDPEVVVSRRFEGLSDRLAVSDGKVFFDGDEVHGVLVDHILRAIGEGATNLAPLVAFYENVAQNPDPHSRENLYHWLQAEKFTIDSNGMIIGYKGVTSDRESIASGSAIVDGVVHTGRIPYADGSVVTMPRSNVQHDPSVGCHTGLHVGTWEYAHTFGQITLEVRVNPRDVVSVPTECGAQKMRCCRLEVVRAVSESHSEAIYFNTNYDEGVVSCEDCDSSDVDSDGYCNDCGCWN